VTNRHARFQQCGNKFVPFHRAKCEQSFLSLNNASLTPKYWISQEICLDEHAGIGTVNEFIRLSVVKTLFAEVIKIELNPTTDIVKIFNEPSSFIVLIWLERRLWRLTLIVRLPTLSGVVIERFSLSLAEEN
jgi:hypothetical protein